MGLTKHLFQILPACVTRNSSAVQMRLMSPLIRAHFKQIIAAGDLVFDVGANVGELTHVFSSLGARVIAIEPQPQCVQALKKRFEASENVTIVEMGVGERVGTLPIYVNKGSHAIASFSDHWVTQSRYSELKWRQSESVGITTLDRLIAVHGRPKFCKIDVEGFEYQVLKGLSTKIPYISFEFISEFLNEARQCIDCLASLGNVRFNYSSYYFYRFQARRWLSADELTRAISKYEPYFWSGDIYARFD